MAKIIHVLCVFDVVDKDILNNKDGMINILKKSASKGCMKIVNVSAVEFKPRGLSIILTITESHIAIHTWPEIGKADLEIVTCGKKSKPFDALNFILKSIKTKKIKKKVINFYI